MNIQEMPRERHPETGHEDRWVTKNTPSGIYAWIGEEYPGGPENWKLPIPLSECGQIIAIVNDRAEFNRNACLAEIERRTKAEWGVLAEYDLKKYGFEDDRIYLAVNILKISR